MPDDPKKWTTGDPFAAHPFDARHDSEDAALAVAEKLSSKGPVTPVVRNPAGVVVAICIEGKTYVPKG